VTAGTGTTVPPYPPAIAASLKLDGSHIGLGQLPNCRVPMADLAIRAPVPSCISHTGPLWELSSFSEAAMTSAPSTLMVPDPPLSRPR